MSSFFFSLSLSRFIDLLYIFPLPFPLLSLNFLYKVYSRLGNVIVPYACSQQKKRLCKACHVMD